MRALIFLDGTVNVDLTTLAVRAAANACYSCGIDVDFHSINATHPSVSQLNDGSFSRYDFFVVPQITGTVASIYYRLIAGNVQKPVMVLAANYRGGYIPGTTGWADSSVGYYYTQVNGSGLNLPVAARRVTLGSFSAPETAIPLIYGGEVGTSSGGEAVTAYKYTLGGTYYSYISYMDTGWNGLATSPFHFFLEEMIKDGFIEPPPVKAPLFMVIDHANDAGEPAEVGGMGGWQENPEPLREIAEVMRGVGGVILTSIEADWQNGTKSATLIANGQPATGNPTLISYLSQYEDVLKYCPYHHHGHVIATSASSPTDPFTTSRSKSDIANITFGETLAAISGYGLTPDYSFAHYANNRSNNYVWELSTPATTKMADPLEASIVPGYGLKLARAGTINESWPHLPYPSATGQYPYHWLRRPIKHRGIVFSCGIDSGLTAMQTTEQKSFNYNFCRLWMNGIHGTMNYLHAEDFEDVAWRTANLAGSPTTTSGGILTETFGVRSYAALAEYAKACPNTLKMGAHPDDYL